MATRSRAPRSLVRWLKRLFNAAPPPPVLLRVAEPTGSPAATVDIAITWYPSGLTATRRHRTAAGLCVIPWLGDEARADLAVRGSGGAASLMVDRDRADGGRVRELALL